MKTFVQKHKKKIITLAIILLTLFLVWAIYKSKQTQQPLTTPSPAALRFDLLRISPSYGVGAQIINTSAIEFKFSKSIDVSTLVITIEPDVDFSFETDDKDKLLFIRAIPNWETDQKYSVSVDVKSKEGENLQDKIEYQLQIKPITTSELTEQFFTPEPTLEP